MTILASALAFLIGFFAGGALMLQTCKEEAERGLLTLGRKAFYCREIQKED